MAKRIPKNFSIGDANVYADNTLSPYAKALYGLLCCYSDKNRECFPGIARLAWEMGVDRRTVQRWMRELKDAGIVLRDEDNKGKNTKTVILDSTRKTWKMYDEFMDPTVII
jgi:pyocin large subunit-like protein